MTIFIRSVQALCLALALALLCGFYYLMHLCFMGQVAADAYYQQHGSYPGEGQGQSFSSEVSAEEGEDNPFAAYESCQSPRQQAYMREHQRRLDEEAASRRSSGK
jgi:K+-transporting ATPase c subunit